MRNTLVFMVLVCGCAFDRPFTEGAFDPVNADQIPSAVATAFAEHVGQDFQILEARICGGGSNEYRFTLVSGEEYVFDESGQLRE